MKKLAVNPYLPNYEYVPDGEPRVFGDRLYVYGSHDTFDGDNFCLGDYVGWSAPVSDLADWRYEGILYSVKQDPDYSPDRDCRLFAPDCQQGPDGRYYLYYAITREGSIGVAVCDTPAGTYQYYGHVHYPDGTRLGGKEEDVFQYDPAILVDDDKRVFLYSGFCFNLQKMPFFRGLKENRKGPIAVELEQDMLTIKEKPHFVIPGALNARGTDFEGHGFFEATSIRKVGSKYYFIYSSELGHELCYAVSDCPDRGFRYGGTLISNGDIGWQGNTSPMNYTGTNHGSIVCVNGDWYVFYHRQTNGHPYSRQGCADKITILQDGSIPQVCMTSQGLNGEPLPGRGTYGANIACCLMSAQGACDIPARTRLDRLHPRFTQEGSDREENPGQYLSSLCDGAQAGYRSFAFHNNMQIAVVCRGEASGKLIISTEMNGKATAEVQMVPSAQWKTLSAPCSLPDGVYDLWIRYQGDGAVDIRSFTLS